MEKYFVILLFLVACSPTMSINDSVFDVEVVTTPEDQAKGLMFRENLDNDEGMLFIFKNSDDRTFWMKNTLIPLDIIFINDSKIQSIHYATPCLSDDCPVYPGFGDMVLEINGNLTKKLGIRKGDSVLLK